ncbi:unnamed protein product [Eruca vesicaria subsp. sativa]|uniref:C2H2-type domain-containing protein n=1 Tax=Eruca vesicaria subsp. sativa TaxID=29727 RepID=A0ABC8LF46_ERUVS|nr:unnamed protein product [Eruca vesicaria subsp. sativa]
MAGRGGALARAPRAGVWWDLNTCTIPDGIDPSSIRGCIESAVHKAIGCRSSIVIMYAIGNLEYIPADLLDKIALSGITLIHAPCGGKDLIQFLDQWCGQHPSGYIMVISGDYTMVNPHRYKWMKECTKFCAYPKGYWPTTPPPPSQVFAKEFVWETLVTDNPSCAIEGADEPLCICDICDAVYNTCNEFTTHLKSEQHRETLFGIVPVDFDLATMSEWPRYFCPVCNYPAYDEYNLLLHNASEEHTRKLAEKEPQAEDCQSRKRNPLEDLSYERNKKQAIIS